MLCSARHQRRGHIKNQERRRRLPPSCHAALYTPSCQRVVELETKKRYWGRGESLSSKADWFSNHLPPVLSLLRPGTVPASKQRTVQDVDLIGSNIYGQIRQSMAYVGLARCHGDSDCRRYGVSALAATAAVVFMLELRCLTSSPLFLSLNGITTTARSSWSWSLKRARNAWTFR